MAGTPTPRLSLPVPAEDDPADVPADLSKLAVALDSGGSGSVTGGVAFDNQGVLSSRPAPGVRGRYYFATDLGVLYRDDGTAWTAFVSGVYYPGDYKHSRQPADHGDNGGGGFEWLLVGSARSVSKTLYPNLWAILGSPAVDGSGNFALPVAAGRALVATGAATGVTTRTSGTIAGAETVTLTAAQIPAHAHPVDDPGHAHLYDVLASGGTGTAGGTGQHGAVIATANATTGLTVKNNTGGGGSHPNVPPLLAENLFIKT
jgi:microcystin-dependent protein